MTNLAKSSQISAKKSKGGKNKRAEFVGYVSLTLTEEHREKYEVWAATEQGIQDAHNDAFDLGYQLGIKRDVSDGTFSCSISCWDEKRPDAGIIYTAYASEFWKSVLKALFVWDYVLKRDLGNGSVKNQGRDAF